MVVYAFSPSTLEAEAGKSLSAKPAWSTKRVSGHPGATMSQKKTTPNKQTNTPHRASLNLELQPCM